MGLSVCPAEAARAAALPSSLSACFDSLSAGTEGPTGGRWTHCDSYTHPQEYSVEWVRGVYIKTPRSQKLKHCLG